ncbi:hypothetical protein RND81_04G207800 [Saponaria officinalis]|uniref:Uncharacterized protein n=1 Tax=Saponaria officinalis TaxID=3572 RepID=A0AAW1LN09_SAPOF
MGLLEQLWDDTVAGPHPDSGLGKLRKFNTFSPRSKDNNEGMSSGRSYGEDSATTGGDNSDGVKVTRSIMIVKPPGYQQSAGSAPASPAGSTPPVSPFSDQEHSDFVGDLRRTRMRRKQQARLEPAETLLLLKMSDI